MVQYGEIGSGSLVRIKDKLLFIAQLVEHRTGIAEVMGSNPVEASAFFLGFVYSSAFKVTSQLRRSLSFL